MCGPVKFRLPIQIIDEDDHLASRSLMLMNDNGELSLHVEDQWYADEVVIMLSKEDGIKLAHALLKECL